MNLKVRARLGVSTALIVGVSRGAGETGTAANKVMDAAGQLSQQAEQLRGEIVLYITEVKAA